MYRKSSSFDTFWYVDGSIFEELVLEAQKELSKSLEILGTGKKRHEISNGELLTPSRTYLTECSNSVTDPVPNAAIVYKLR